MTEGLAQAALGTSKQSEEGVGFLGLWVGLPFLGDLSSPGKGQRQHSDICTMQTHILYSCYQHRVSHYTGCERVSGVG